MQIRLYHLLDEIFFLRSFHSDLQSKLDWIASDLEVWRLVVEEREGHSLY